MKKITSLLLALGIGVFIGQTSLSFAHGYGHNSHRKRHRSNKHASCQINHQTGHIECNGNNHQHRFFK